MAAAGAFAALVSRFPGSRRGPLRASGLVSPLPVVLAVETPLEVVPPEVPLQGYVSPPVPPEVYVPPRLPPKQDRN